MPYLCWKKLCKYVLAPTPIFSNEWCVVKATDITQDAAKKYCFALIPQISSLHSQIRSQESDLRSQEDELGRSKVELSQLQEEEAQLEQSLLSGRVQLDSIIKSLKTSQEEINQVRLHRSSRVSVASDQRPVQSVKVVKVVVHSQRKLKKNTCLFKLWNQDVFSHFIHDLTVFILKTV